MMGSGEDLKKLIGALGPGAMSALDTIMGKESEAAAKWAAGGGIDGGAFVGPAGGADMTGIGGIMGGIGAGKGPQGPPETASAIALREAWMRGEFDEMVRYKKSPNKITPYLIISKFE